MYETLDNIILDFVQGSFPFQVSTGSVYAFGHLRMSLSCSRSYILKRINRFVCLIQNSKFLRSQPSNKIKNKTISRLRLLERRAEHPGFQSFSDFQHVSLQLISNYIISLLTYSVKENEVK